MTDLMQASPETEAVHRAASFLSRVAGISDRHIEMQSAGDHKYKEYPGMVTPDLARQHLEGQVTVGAALWCGDGTSCAVCWDADNEEAWGALERAAAALDASGAHPILAPSPGEHHVGGGHAWLVFDDVINALDAFATAFVVAPELRDMRERFPSGRRQVRLPGGYYIWMREDAYADMPCESALYASTPDWTTGVFAIEDMMAHQTPSTWVTETEPSVIDPRAAQIDVGPAIHLPF